MTDNFVNVHILRAVPASLMNRDNFNAPKSTTYGGVKRDRWSSQSLKRAVREAMAVEQIDNGVWGERSYLVPREVIRILVDEHGVDEAIAAAKTMAAFASTKLPVNDDKYQTKNELYVSGEAKQQIARIVAEHFDEITDEVPAEVTSAILGTFVGARVPDIALFGRFMASIPHGRIDGAAGYAHAFSVGPSSATDDFWTAKDDIADINNGDTQANNMGVSELTSPVMYQHSHLDRRQLRHNLDETIDPKEIEKRWLFHTAVALPQAKVNSTSAKTSPSLIIVTTGNLNLSAGDAFVTPVTNTSNVLGDAMDALLDKVKRNAGLSGGSIYAVSLSRESDAALANFPDVEVKDSLSALIDAVEV